MARATAHQGLSFGIWTIRAIITIGFLLVVFWLANHHFAWIGQPQYRQTFQGQYLLISDFDGVLGKGTTQYNEGRPLKKRASAFRIFKHTGFTALTLGLMYHNDNQEVVSLALEGRPPMIIEDRRFQGSNIIEYLQRQGGDFVWREGGFFLWQRSPQPFQSFNSFFQDLPASMSVVRYNNPSLEPVLRDILAFDTFDESFPYEFRGSHSGYLITTGSRPSVTLQFVDKNRSQGADDVTITLYRDGKQIKAITVADDDNTTQDKHASHVREQQLILPADSWYNYAFVIEASPDIYIQGITTHQTLLAFENRVRLSTLHGALTLYIQGMDLKITPKDVSPTTVTATTVLIDNEMQPLPKRGKGSLLVPGAHKGTSVMLTAGGVELRVQGLFAMAAETQGLFRLADTIDIADITNPMDRLATADVVYGFFTPPMVTADGQRQTTLTFPLTTSTESFLTGVVGLPQYAQDEAGVTVTTIEAQYER